MISITNNANIFAVVAIMNSPIPFNAIVQTSLVPMAKYLIQPYRTTTSSQNKTNFISSKLLKFVYKPGPKWASFSARAGPRNPKDLQTTLAASSLKSSSQIVPQVAWCRISTRPSVGVCPPINLISSGAYWLQYLDCIKYIFENKPRSRRGLHPSNQRSLRHCRRGMSLGCIHRCFRIATFRRHIVLLVFCTQFLIPMRIQFLDYNY